MSTIATYISSQTSNSNSLVNYGKMELKIIIIKKNKKKDLCYKENYLKSNKLLFVTHKY